MADHQFSIVIPVFNEAENLPQLLKKIRALELADLEIIIVDDGSTDRGLPVSEDVSDRDESGRECYPPSLQYRQWRGD